MSSLELLHCYEVHPPFVYERVGDAPVALVIENHHTYDSARRVLSGSDRGIGFVVYGAGRAFEASVTYLADLGVSVERVAYFGDLDSAGLSIPVGASATWEQAGGSAIEPAGPLYRALLETGTRQASVPSSLTARLGNWWRGCRPTSKKQPGPPWRRACGCPKKPSGSRSSGPCPTGWTDSQEVLAGSVGFVVHYDQMSPAEQAVVRRRWDAGMDRRLAALDLAANSRPLGSRSPTGREGSSKYTAGSSGSLCVMT